MKKQVLLLSRWFPDPPDNGAKKRIFSLISQLQQEYDVTLISFYDVNDQIDKPTASLSEFCKAIYRVPYPAQTRHYGKRILGWLSVSPRMFVERDSAEFSAIIDKVCTLTKFDMVIASQIDMAPYGLQANAPCKILEELEITVITDQLAKSTNLIERFRKKLTVEKLRVFLDNILPKFDWVTTVSEDERQAILKLTPGANQIKVIQNGIDIGKYSGSFGIPVPGTLIYAGAITYSANYDAVEYFINSIYPLIRSKNPDTTLSITGSTKGVEYRALSAAPAVTFTGYLDDIKPAIAQSWINIVPLRVGGGTRVKILESLALGTPVVTTTKGAQGLALRPDEDILIGDTPEEFSRQVIRLLNDAALRERLSRNGKQTVSDIYSWETIGREFLVYLSRLNNGQPKTV